jgi:hypothetical protein
LAFAFGFAFAFAVILSAAKDPVNPNSPPLIDPFKPNANHLSGSGPKINFKKRKISSTQKKRIFPPRFTTKPPQSHHQKTTFCTPLFAKPPAKTPVHHPNKFSPVTIRKLPWPTLKTRS